MPVNLHGRNVLTLDDFSGAEIRYLLRLAADLRQPNGPASRWRA
jgi:ornithine carbamoyltransferase